MESRATPCGACKFLRRKCMKACIFAPYFCSDEMGAPQFGAIHKVFGASNVSKLLMDLPVQQRHAAVASVSYEAQARLQDPVFGCVSHILALQHQVANLMEELTLGYAQLAACSNSNRASLKSEYVSGKQSEMPYLIPSSKSMSVPSTRQYIAWGDLQSVPLEKVSINNYGAQATGEERSSSSFSLFMKEKCSMNPTSALPTSNETYVFENAKELYEQK